MTSTGNPPHSTHPADEQLDAWLDARLSAQERREVEAHIAGCARCARLARALRAARATLRAGLTETPAPAGLAERIGAALDAEDRRIAGRRSAPRAPRWHAAGLAAAAVAAAFIVWWQGRSETDLVDELATQYATLERGALPEALAAEAPEPILRRWAAAKLGFPVRVLDLSAMGVRLVGGGPTTLAKTNAALTVYRSASGLVLCWMLPAVAAEVPLGAEVRSHRGFEFSIYRRGGRTVVLWREGDVLCALTARGDPESVVALAFAKAMAPASI